MIIDLTDGRQARLVLSSDMIWRVALRADDPIEPMLDVAAPTCIEALDQLVTYGLIDGRSLARLRREALAL